MHAPRAAAFAYDDGDIDTNRSTAVHLDDLVAARLSRRAALGGGVALMGGAVFGSDALAAAQSRGPASVCNRLGFAAVPKHLGDIVTVPAGYSVSVLYRAGDPIAAGMPAFANDGSDRDYARRAGDHHDGMSFFGLAASGRRPDPAANARGLLVLNHENITEAYLHPAGPTMVAGARPEGEALKEIECHGVSVIAVSRGRGGWRYDPRSRLNRRITPHTPMAFSGPVRGVPALRTRHSPDGTTGRGTINNCANGTLAWNTYLTCEENWAGYFRRAAGDAAVRGTTPAGARANTALARYGIAEGRGGNHGWATVRAADAASTLYRRWDASADSAAPADGSGDFRNEPAQFGWVVEIDPFDPASTPRKRTALGRFNHEGCEPGRMIPGVRPAFYMGDDAQNEYIYKFVSERPWDAADAAAPDRLAVGDRYLDRGTLYVARFEADGSGQWMPLVFGRGPLTAANPRYAFQDQADVLVNARLAADALGATPMDRPEWTAVSPVTGEMYCTLTNNRSLRPETTNTANPRAYVNRRADGRQTVGNVNGHIVRLREAGDSSEATRFAWDVYAYAARADADRANVNLSALDDDNDFSSPDGLWFGRASNATGQGSPLLWIQTDDSAYTDVSNCMMLAAIPGRTGDGEVWTITNVTPAGSATQTARIGRAPGDAMRRFMVGPRECEITGIASTPDGRALFVNIQHPGENGDAARVTSHWPASQTDPAARDRPRSATIVVTRDDGGVVGL